ncbi:hypothetical protein OHV82_09315, partial [Acinetobacter baumannii]|nr:hypothetical protein [Acinetobacter baumannii]
MALTPEVFRDLERDIADAGKAVNVDAEINPRYGLPFKSLPMVSRLFEAMIAAGYLRIDDLQSAIEAAAAAGAGANGWTADLVVDGDQTQRQINLESIKNYSNMPKGMFNGQPAKFNGIQYIWNAESVALHDDNLIIQVEGVSIGRWIIHAYDGCIYSDTVNDLQAALDYCSRNKLKFVLTGNVSVDKNLYVRTFEADSSTDRFVFDGQSHKLKFTTGVLHIQTAEMNMFDLTVETTDASAKAAIILRPFFRPYDSTIG